MLIYTVRQQHKIVRKDVEVDFSLVLHSVWKENAMTAIHCFVTIENMRTIRTRTRNVNFLLTATVQVPSAPASAQDPPLYTFVGSKGSGRTHCLMQV